MSAFDRRPTLTANPIALAPLLREDFEPLAAAASDPLIWEVHPAGNRHERAVFASYFEVLVTRLDCLSIRINGEVAGCSAYYTAPDRPGTISIGYTFLARKFWGGDYNFLVKKLMVEHAFQHFPDVWFHINLTNIRSQKATQKLGAVLEYEANLDLSGSGNPDDWKVYRLSSSAWADTLSRRPSTA